MLSETRAPESPPEPRSIWYKLVNASNGEPLSGTKVDAISIRPNALMYEVRDAIYKRHPHRLKHIETTDLKIYENESLFKMMRENGDGEPLSPAGSIGAFESSFINPIIVAVPDSSLAIPRVTAVPSLLPQTVELAAENGKKNYLYLSDKGKISKTEKDAAHSYSKLAKRIQDDPEAKAYIDALWEKFKEGRDLKVFNALCVPSGTGKTQLAFALPQEQCACIYLNMDVSSSDASARQPVYGAFRGYMVQFIRWLKEDYREDSSSGYRLYGFVYALIQLLIEHPELELPSDLSRLVISNIDQPGFKTFEVSPKLLGAVQFEAERLTNSTGKDLVFFIDEFAFSSDLSQEQLAFLRRTLMDTGSCVIVASTDSGALNMFNTAAATAASRGNDNPWVQLCTQLPKYVPDRELRSAIAGCKNHAVKTLLSLCIDSRPLFAETVAGRIRRYLAKRRGNISGEISLIEQLREDLLPALRRKTSATSVEGCFGNVMAMLLAGGALVSGDESRMRIYGNLTTKSWAYLVHDPSVFKIEQPDPKPSKRARLQSTILVSDRVVRMTTRHASPAFLTIKRRPGDVRGKDVLYYTESNSPGRIFSCTSFFPDPREDFLLYLVLAGSKAEPGLRVAGSAPGSELFPRISVAKLVNLVFEGCPKLPSSVSNLLPSFAEHEAVVCAAFYTACNAGGLSGCSLEELVTRFVAELAAPGDCLYPQLGTVDKIPWSGEFTARFAFPFNTELPIEVHETLKSVKTDRPDNREYVDAVTYMPKKSGEKTYEVLVEAKASTKPDYVRSRIENALQRQDANAKISFIVVDKNVDANMRFDTSKYQYLDRSKKGDRKSKKGDTLEARVFLVDLDKTNKVILKAIDRQSEDAVADRVIFVIDVKRINDHLRESKKRV